EERDLEEPGFVTKPGAAATGAGDHLARKIDPDDAVPGPEQDLADQPRPAARIEHQAVGGKVGRGHQTLQRRPVALHRGALELRGLAVEGGGQVAVVVLHAVLSEGGWSGP